METYAASTAAASQNTIPVRDTRTTPEQRAAQLALCAAFAAMQDPYEAAEQVRRRATRVGSRPRGRARWRGWRACVSARGVYWRPLSSGGAVLTALTAGGRALAEVTVDPSCGRSVLAAALAFLDNALDAADPVSRPAHSIRAWYCARCETKNRGADATCAGCGA
jgi:hypothetical protein